MKFLTRNSKPVQPELVASKDKTRPVLSKVHLNVEKSRVEVTDSYILAVFPVELDEGDTSGPIPVDALKASRKMALDHGRNKFDSKIKCNSKVEVFVEDSEPFNGPYYTTDRDENDYTFPQCDCLFPENVAPFEIGLNIGLLTRLAKSMGTETIRLRFTADNDGNPSPLRPILVDPLTRVDDNQPRGILMPVRVP